MKTKLITSLTVALSLPVVAAPENKVGGFSSGGSSSQGFSSSSSMGSSGSSSQSIKTHTDASGTTVTEITTEENGKRTTRKITVGPDGKVEVSDGATPPPSKDPAPKAPEKAGGWLGVHTIPLTDVVRKQLDIPDGQGIAVEIVAEGGPAALAGLKPHDILLAINDQPITSVEDFRAKLSALAPGKPVKFSHLRKGKLSDITATLASRPPDAEAGADVKNESERMLKELREKQGSGKKSILLNEDGDIQIEQDSTEDPFEMLLNNPNVPEVMKAQIRKSQEDWKRLRDLHDEKEDAGTPEEK